DLVCFFHQRLQTAARHDVRLHDQLEPIVGFVELLKGKIELADDLGIGSGRGRVFIGRDTRASGRELEEAFARGVASAGGSAVLAGVVPTPAVALLRLDLGVVISASHNPPEYNGVKFFDRDGHKLSDAVEEQIEGLLDAPAPG